jgi:hypothetical protein
MLGLVLNSGKLADMNWSEFMWVLVLKLVKGTVCCMILRYLDSVSKLASVPLIFDKHVPLYLVWSLSHYVIFSDFGLLWFSSNTSLLTVYLFPVLVLLYGTVLLLVHAGWSYLTNCTYHYLLFIGLFSLLVFLLLGCYFCPLNPEIWSLLVVLVLGLSCLYLCWFMLVWLVDIFLIVPLDAYLTCGYIWPCWLVMVYV